MIPFLTCLLILQTPAQAPNAQDFFPAVPGSVRTYEVKGGGSSVIVHKVGKPLDMGGASVIPLTESGVGSDKTTYYRITPDQVVVIAYDINKPMTTPMPIIKVGPGKVTWDFQGTTQVGVAGERLLEHGESRLSGQRTVLGKKVDILTVKLTAAVGVGLSGETFEQTIVYGKGVGMIEQTTKMRLGRRTVETSLKLVSIENGS